MPFLLFAAAWYHHRLHPPGVHMIGVLIHHWAKADKTEEAKNLLDGTGLAQSRERAAAMKGAEQLWSKPPESERVPRRVTASTRSSYAALKILRRRDPSPRQPRTIASRATPRPSCGD